MAEDGLDIGAEEGKSGGKKKAHYYCGSSSRLNWWWCRGLLFY